MAMGCMLISNAYRYDREARHLGQSLSLFNILLNVVFNNNNVCNSNITNTRW